MTAYRKSVFASMMLLAAPLLAAPQDMIAVRQAGYRAMGAAYKSVNDQLRSGSPQMPVLQAAAARIQATAKAQYGWFPQGSGAASGQKTAAKDEIWSQPAAFKAAQDALTAQSAAFAKAVASGDVAAITASSKALGASCGGCHRQFRSDVRG